MLSSGRKEDEKVALEGGRWVRDYCEKRANGGRENNETDVERGSRTVESNEQAGDSGL